MPGIFLADPEKSHQTRERGIIFQSQVVSNTSLGYEYYLKFGLRRGKITTNAGLGVGK